MPFWKGDRAGRPLELGLAIGRLMRDLLRLPPAAAIDRLTREHDLDAARRREPAAVPARSDGGRRRRARRGDDRRRARARRARRLARLRAVAARRAHSRAVGDGGRGEDPRGDRHRRRNALGRRRVRGEVSGRGRAAGPAAAAAGAGRSPGAGRPAARRDGALRREVPRERGAVAAAAEAPPRHARAALAAAQARGRSARRRVALRIVSRCCSKPTASACATSSTCRRSSRRSADIRSRKLRVATVDSETPSPFAASLLFSYVASFLYDGDAPLAERRAQALAVDQAQLRELLGDAELRELLDADAMDAIERQLQRLDPQYQVKSADGVHDMLLSLGDLDRGGDRRALDQRGRRRQRRRARGARGGCCRSASRASRGSSRSKTRRGSATRSACRCRPAFPNRCCSRCAIRSAIWRSATRARTRRSRRRTSPRATRLPSRRRKRCCCG